LDLLVVSGGRRLGFEIKRTDAPKLTASMKAALETLGIRKLTVVHAGATTFKLSSRVRAVAARDLLREVKPLRR
jgi:LmbE family N-acetylglucosaminyl deacetylase